MRVSATRSFRSSAGVLCLSATLSSAATVTVDQTVAHQTMDGFGAAIADWLIPHNNYQAYCSQIVGDLGLTLMRIMMVQDFENQNDNSDPFSAGTFNTGAVAEQREVLQKLYSAGLRNVCLSTFSPPGWMKTNNSVTDGGELRTDMYDEFCEHYCAYIRFVESTGLNVYAISPQNEPSFALWYASCVYSPLQMKNIVKALGQRFELEGIDTRIFWAEELFEQPWQPFAGNVLADTSAKRYGDIVAIHHQNFYDTTRWSPAYRNARALINGTNPVPYAVGFWNSEMSNYAAGWTGALQMATGFVISLRDARMSGILYGSPSIVPEQALEALMVDRVPTERYYVAKQFYRYVRPGAVMVQAASDDASVMTVAFVHPAEQTMTVVLVNTSSTAKSVILAGTGLPQFTQVRTSATETCDTIGSVTASVSLPASSVTTLYGTGHVSAVRQDRSVAIGRAVAHGPGAHAAWYSASGRRVAGLSTGAPGVRLSNSGVRIGYGSGRATQLAP